MQQVCLQQSVDSMDKLSCHQSCHSQIAIEGPHEAATVMLCNEQAYPYIASMCNNNAIMLSHLHVMCFAPLAKKLTAEGKTQMQLRN